MKSAPRQVSSLEKLCLRDASTEMFRVLTSSQVLLVVNTNTLYRQEVDVKSRIFLILWSSTLLSKRKLKTNFGIRNGVLWSTTIFRKYEWTCVVIICSKLNNSWTTFISESMTAESGQNLLENGRDCEKLKVGFIYLLWLSTFVLAYKLSFQRFFIIYFMRSTSNFVWNISYVFQVNICVWLFCNANAFHYEHVVGIIKSFMLLIIVWSPEMYVFFHKLQSENSLRSLANSWYRFLRVLPNTSG